MARNQQWELPHDPQGDTGARCDLHERQVKKLEYGCTHQKL